jgi:hypothetical protein
MPESLHAVATRLSSTCPLTKFAGHPETCRWCGDRLERDQRTFCSRRCSTTFWSEHSWTAAKRECKRRARRKCATCGKPGGATGAVHHLAGAVEGGRTRLASCDHHQDPDPVTGTGGLLFACWACHQGEHHGADGDAAA